MNRPNNYYYSSSPSDMLFKEAFYAGADARLNGLHYTDHKFLCNSLPADWTPYDLLFNSSPCISGWLLGWWSCDRVVGFHTDPNAIHDEVTGAAAMAALLWKSVHKV